MIHRPFSAPAALLSAAASMLALPASATAQLAPAPLARTAAQTDAVAPPPYAFLADLTLAAPVIVVATVRGATRIKGAEAAAVAPGLARLYVQADVTALVRGAGGLPPRIGWLVDVAAGPDGRLPRLKNAELLVFGRPARAASAGPEAAGQIQLVSPDAQLDWTPQVDATVRGIARDALAADAPPRITGVGRAFYVAGTLPGEGETQIFLATADARPVSLSILRRPGERQRWAVALSEIVDEAAAPPPRDTLLWYRLACFLPRALPGASTDTLEAADADAARADYRFVLGQLGACGARAQVARGAPRADPPPTASDPPAEPPTDQPPRDPAGGGAAASLSGGGASG